MNTTPETYWQAEQDLVHRILHEGMVPYVARLDHVDTAFGPEPRVVRCIDERVTGNIAVAGSGILLGLDKTAAMLADAELQGITSHAGCGAVGLYCQQNGIEAAQVEMVAQEFAQQLAAKLGVPYQGHQVVEPAFHVARALYYTSAPTFDPRLCQGLPAGFVVSRAYHPSAETALEEVKIAIDIAFGAHGFADRFTSTTPLLLIVVDDARTATFSLQQLEQELQRVVVEHAEAPRLKVLGFSAL